jgi:hypothetical protein
MKLGWEIGLEFPACQHGGFARFWTDFAMATEALTQLNARKANRRSGLLGSLTLS